MTRKKKKEKKIRSVRSNILYIGRRHVETVKRLNEHRNMHLKLSRILFNYFLFYLYFYY